MDVRKAIEESNALLMNTYNRFPVVLRKGRGVKVWGADGKEYLDFVGGIAVNVLGHCHPKVVLALQKQAQRLIHVSNLYHTEPQVRLAKILVEKSFADRVFFCNSGAEANEAAIKLARKYACEHLGPGRYEIITALGSFHGRTFGALSATGQEKLQKGFEPLLPGFSYVPYNDLNALRETVCDKTCAVMLEPLQGEAGVRVPAAEYLREVRRICDSAGVLLILDEVQTGVGRTGKLFAYERSGAAPDIMTLAKGLANGLPIGAMLATEKVSQAFRPADHASTFGGNPVACAAAAATLETILEDGLILEHCNRTGGYLTEKLLSIKVKYPSLVIDVRGMGLLAGMELTRECAPVVKAALERGLLLNCAAGNVLRFMPPLIVEENDIDRMADILEDVFESLR